jgi:hypothetical protein
MKGARIFNTTQKSMSEVIGSLEMWLAIWYLSSSRYEGRTSLNMKA